MSLVHGQVPSPSVQSLGFPAPSMSFPHPVPEHGLLFGGLLLSLSAWCLELWWALMEREMTQVCWLGADLLVPVKAQCSLCLAGSKWQKSFPVSLSSPELSPSAVLRAPSAASTARVIFHHLCPSSGPCWSCGEAPVLLLTPLCFLHTRLFLVWAAPGLQSSESNPGSKREETRIGCKNFGTCFH